MSDEMGQVLHLRPLRSLAEQHPKNSPAIQKTVEISRLLKEIVSAMDRRPFPSVIYSAPSERGGYWKVVIEHENKDYP